MNRWAHLGQSLLILGLICGGVAVFCWPAALIVAGLFLLADRLSTPGPKGR